MRMRLPSHKAYHHHHHHVFSGGQQFYPWTLLLLLLILWAGLLSMAKSSAAEGARTAPPPPAEMMRVVNSSELHAVRKVLCSMYVFPAWCGNNMLEGKMTAADISSPLAFAKRNLELAASELSALRSSSPLTSGFRLTPNYDYLLNMSKSLRSSTSSLTAPRPKAYPDNPRFDVIKNDWGECRVIFDEVNIVLEGILEKLGGGEEITEEERVEMVRSLARGHWHMELCYVGLSTEGSGWVESFSPILHHLWDYSGYSSFALFVLHNLKVLETRMMMRMGMLNQTSYPS